MDGGSTSGGSICLYATGGSICLYATLDPHLLVALPGAAWCLARSDACPDGVALALALGYPVGHPVG